MNSVLYSLTNRVARESSRVIILKSRLNSAGHSVCTSEVRVIFDRQTHVPNVWWQLMCSRVLQLWGRRYSTTAPVRNITTVPNGFSGYSFINPVCAHAVFERSTDQELHNPSRTSSDGRWNKLDNVQTTQKHE